ncbi:hypothetical protein [Streptomyces gibsoniae]|uniref:Uncharacterized protein n=1 Tax=Streptomyces gibsoniae TaxID=3075529 RepID=A0ABU2UA28_9ACTN|nr:hypothetical protein [Streptomyces sp. DSM 41699]MDT0470072.1 hypothetical protein [Streptomyces sp. DSM 41699]
MSDMATARARALGDLIAASHLMTFEQVPAAVAAHAARAGWSETLIYLQPEFLETRVGLPPPPPATSS